jgi:hypothetical protein
MKSLEELLEFLCRYGEPMMWKGKAGWHCKIEVFVTGQGMKFEISSDSKHPTLHEAAECCIKRLVEAFTAIEKNAGTLKG